MDIKAACRQPSVRAHMLSLPWMLKNKMSCKKTWTLIKYAHRRCTILAITVH